MSDLTRDWQCTRMAAAVLVLRAATVLAMVTAPDMTSSRMAPALR